MTQWKRFAQAFFWISLYLVITLAPIFIILLADPRPPGREFWRDLSVVLGYSGLAMVGLQFVLTARFKTLKAPYGSDLVYFFHRQISLVSFTLIAIHPLLLFLFDPELLKLLNPITAPWAARFGVGALLALLGLIAASVWRKKLKIEYDRWRIWHGLLAVIALAFALVHIELRGYYLNTIWKQFFWAFYAFAWISVLLWVRVIKPAYLVNRPYQVTKVIPERGNTWTIVLEPDGHDGFQFQAGQFAWISIWDSPFRDREHPFSFSGSANDPKQLQFTIKALGDFTGRISHLTIGQKVYVDGPYGAFSMDQHPDAKSYFFIAGGVGITPIMSMMQTLADRGDLRPLTLMFANKTLEAATFLEEIEMLKSRLNLKVIHVIESPSPDYPGESGFINAAMIKKYLPEELQKNFVEIFVCGPAPMMNAVEKALVKLGVPMGDFHSERFDLV